MSRKHAVEIDEHNMHLSIFGGKLTDCLNVGEEIVEEVRKLGVDIPSPNFRWYGEPEEAVRLRFMDQAKAMDLDAMTSPESSEPLSIRLWRRYGELAMDMLEEIRRDPKQGEVLIKGTEYLRCELHQAARHEMVTRLEDFLRRRAKISLVVPEDTIRDSPGLMEACEILFGDKARERLDEYLAEEADPLLEALSADAETDNPAHSEKLRW